MRKADKEEKSLPNASRRAITNADFRPRDPL